MQNKNPTLNDAVKIFSDKEILQKLFELYPDQKKSKKGYEKVLLELRSLKAKGTGMKVVVESTYDDIDKKSYTHVYGAKTGKKETYAIEYVPWNEWLGMRIEKTALKTYNYLEIVAHCLWEMTWSGFDQKAIKMEIESLRETVKQIKKDDGIKSRS